MYNLLHNVQVMQQMTFEEVHVKRSVILTDRLGPDILLVLTMKRQVLYRERVHFKVPGCSLVLSALLTKKLPTFLSRLNEISGGCEKILPVSGSSETSVSGSSKCQVFRISVRWPIYIINSIDKTKLKRI